MKECRVNVWEGKQLRSELENKYAYMHPRPQPNFKPSWQGLSTADADIIYICRYNLIGWSRYQIMPFYAFSVKLKTMPFYSIFKSTISKFSKNKKYLEDSPLLLKGMGGLRMGLQKISYSGGKLDTLRNFIESCKYFQIMMIFQKKYIFWDIA